MIKHLSLKRLFFLLLFFLLPLPVTALDILVLPTVVDTEMDAWQHVPVGSEPTLYPTGRLYRGQPFRLLVLGKDYTTDSDKNTAITYTVRIIGPTGAHLLDQSAPLELFKGKVSGDALLLLSRQHLNLDFSETDLPGTYRFVVTARDLKAEQKVTSTAEVELAPVSERPDFDSSEALAQWLADYYRAPDPARAITALLQYVDTEPELRMQQIPLLTFLVQVFQHNPFLWPHLKAVYAHGNLTEQKKILLISALSKQEDEVFFSNLEPKLASFYKDAQKTSLPVPTDRPTTELDIDMLWAEFVATGTFAPIKKLVGALSLESTRGTQDQIDAGSLELTPEVRARAALEKVYQSALSSLLYNGERHSLVKQYLNYLYENEQTEPIIKNQLEQILDLLQKRSNEEEARKHLEEQGREQ